MNTKEYIASGILESYLLGALSQDEMTTVEADIVMYPELQEELRSIEDAMIQFAEANAKVPPAGTKDKIWDAIEKKPAQLTNTPIEHKAKNIPLRKETRLIIRQAAIWVLIISSLFLNVLFWSVTKDKKESIASLSEEVKKMKLQQNELSLLLENYKKQTGMMADTGMQTIVLHTVLKGHPMAATVYWSKDNGSVYVSVDALPMPPKGMQYQLWVMQDGKPVDIGVLPNDMVGKPDMQKIDKAVMNSQAFAISLEKEGGAPQPTAENIYVMGRVI